MLSKIKRWVWVAVILIPMHLSVGVYVAYAQAQAGVIGLGSFIAGGTGNYSRIGAVYLAAGSAQQWFRLMFSPAALTAMAGQYILAYGITALENEVAQHGGLSAWALGNKFSVQNGAWQKTVTSNQYSDEALRTSLQAMTTCNNSASGMYPVGQGSLWGQPMVYNGAVPTGAAALSACQAACGYNCNYSQEYRFSNNGAKGMMLYGCMPNPWAQGKPVQTTSYPIPESSPDARMTIITQSTAVAITPGEVKGKWDADRAAPPYTTTNPVVDELLKKWGLDYAKPRPNALDVAPPTAFPGTGRTTGEEISKQGRDAAAAQAPGDLGALEQGATTPGIINPPVPVTPPVPVNPTVEIKETYTNPALSGGDAVTTTWPSVPSVSDRFGTFITAVKATSFWQLPGSMSSLPSGGDPSFHISGGVFGEHDYSFASWGSTLLNVVKGVVLVICSWVAIRIATKGGGG